MTIFQTLQDRLRQRPWWMNALMAFCAYMAIIYVPWDMASKPLAEAEEAWFGVMLTGWGARLTEPLHWLIYLAGMIGFWRMSPWMHPWAAVYTLQVAIAMLVWNLVNPGGAGWIAGLIAALPFLLLTALLWRQRLRFISPAAPDTGDSA